MSALRFLDDEAIEALTLGDEVVAELAALAVFAEHVRAVGDGPAPQPSLALQSLISAHVSAVARADRARRVTPPALEMLPGSVASSRRAAQQRLSSIAGKVAGLGVAAKVALGVSIATAGVAGAGAAGVLPGGADRAVRDAIEAVTPLELPGRAPGAAKDAGAGAGPAATRPTAPTSTGPGAREADDAGTAVPTSVGADDPQGAVGDAGGNGPAADDQGQDTATGTSTDPARRRGQRWGGLVLPTLHTTQTTQTTQATPAPAPGDTPGAAGDEGTEAQQARDADAAGPTG
jgi:hypothetical protein